MKRKRGWNKKIRKEVVEILLSARTPDYWAEWSYWSPYIAAIKHYRILTSSPLKEAKDYVDSLPEMKIYEVMKALDRNQPTN